MGVGDEVDRHALVVADKSRKEGTKLVLIVVSDPTRVGGVKAEPETGKQRPTQNAGTMAKRAAKRVIARKIT